MEIIDGILLGLLLSALIGPVFFVLINTAIEKGTRSAFIFDLGVIGGDIFLIAILYGGASEVLGEVLQSHYTQIVGGSVFMVFGGSQLLRRNKAVKSIDIGSRERLKLFAKGIILNITNPAVILFWLGAVAVAASKYSDDGNVFLYFLFTVATLFVLDILKIIAARRLKHLMNGKARKRMDLLTGVVLILAGISMIWKGL